jgi:uncharacterized protein YcbX
MRVAGLRVHPVKALDGTAVDSARITPGGTLAWDRTFALFGPEGDPINGKRTPRVHELDAAFDPRSESLTVTGDGETRTFDLDAERESAEAWFSEYFGVETTIRRDDDLGFVDRQSAGPSVVSTATIEAVASWFDDLTAESVRRRLRANVEIGGVPAFWEDRFVGDGAPTFAAGDVEFEGVTPCGRCVVPARDPDTGAEIEGFRERFIERRKATLPDFADPDAFEHFFTLMLIASVPESDRGKTIRVGDDVAVLEGDGDAVSTTESK